MCSPLIWAALLFINLLKLTDMQRVNMTQYDEYPKDMLIYLKNYGPHFNKKLCEFAVKQMTKMVDGKEVGIVPLSKEQVESVLKKHNVYVHNNVLSDEVYVYHMGESDFMGSSIIDEKHLALYVKDVIDDIDAPDGIVFTRWYASMCYIGIPIEWEEML
jgi:hypothetical protein